MPDSFRRRHCGLPRRSAITAATSEADHGWLLGRFVVPVGRLEELPDDTAFPLAVIIPPEISAEDLDLLGTYRKHIELLEIRLLNDGDSAGRCTAWLQDLHRRLTPSGI